MWAALEQLFEVSFSLSFLRVLSGFLRFGNTILLFNRSRRIGGICANILLTFPSSPTQVFVLFVFVLINCPVALTLSPFIISVLTLTFQEKLISEDPSQVILPCCLSLRFLDDILTSTATTSSNRQAPEVDQSRSTLPPESQNNHGDINKDELLLLQAKPQVFSEELTRMAIMALR